MKDDLRPKTEREVRAAIRRGANVVPLVKSLPADTMTPVGAFLALRDKQPAFLLESVEGGERYARYSFLGARPFETLEVADGRLRVTRGGKTRIEEGDPFRAIGEELTRYRALSEPGLPPFTGGAVGHVGYEMIARIEPTTGLKPPVEEPEARLRVFMDVAAFDRLRQRLVLCANVIAEPGIPIAKAYRRAERALAGMEKRLARPVRPRPARSDGALRLKPRLGSRRFMEGVRSLRRAIRDGEIFQAVLSDRFETPLRASAFDVYRRLRALNPSPYLFFIGSEDDALLGASPEMLVRVEGGAIETRPIAGTRPRGKDEEHDRRLERDLLASVKERAEHLMLVDLGRNDVGRVAAPGSVRVPSFMKVERYSHVMHLVSSVRGKLARGKTAWDAFGACFPAGTVTGAPKVRAVQLLSEIERSPRGFYAGAVVYRDFQGNLDSAIAIRSVAIRGKGAKRKAIVQAGAGVVADSRPAAELAEIRAKARAALEALGG
jgi:anthranilate synthase component 1